MTDYCHTIINELDDRISELTYEQNNSLVSYENAIVLVLQKIEEVKKHIQEKGFKDAEEEILFFKQLKPQLVSKLIFFNSIYKIETKRPRGGIKLSGNTSILSFPKSSGTSMPIWNFTSITEPTAPILITNTLYVANTILS
tara:strand:- start:532 stop:954 length:423 start_codon:yes stop_codon:yes gene_type:complete